MICQFRLLVWEMLNPKATSSFYWPRYQERILSQIFRRKNLRQHLVQEGWWIVNSTGCFFTMHSVFPPASYSPPPLKCGPWESSISTMGEFVKMQILSPCLIKSENLAVRPKNLWFHKPSRGFWCLVSLRTTALGYVPLPHCFWTPNLSGMLDGQS